MELNTINDVIAALDAIVKHCSATKNRSGYFAALYKRMTEAVAVGITKGAFEDGKRMEALDVAFAKRYLDAWNLYSKGEVCTTAWKGAFDSCTNESLTVIQHLLLGINTHINLDLAIAAATVAPGDQIHELANDFNRINDVITSLVDDVQKCLEEVWFPMRWIKRIAANQQQDVLNFSIGVARKTAWANALLLANMQPAETSLHIRKMDTKVHQLGTKIINPGLWPGFILKLVRWTEYEDVSRTIHLIDTTVVE